MTSIELKHQTQLTKWVELIKECRGSGLSVKSWCQQSGVAPTTYYRWERAVLAEAETDQRTASPLFAEVPVPHRCGAWTSIPDVIQTERFGASSEQSDGSVMEQLSFLFDEAEVYQAAEEKQATVVAEHKRQTVL